MMLFVRNDPGGDTLNALSSAENIYMHIFFMLNTVADNSHVGDDRY